MQLSIEFLKHYFADRQDMATPVLLLLDDFAGHWRQDVVDYASSLSVVFVKVPPRHIAVCQSADVSWNAPFKAYLREAWTQDIVDQLQDHTRRVATEPTPFRLVGAGRRKVTQWIVSSWGRLSADILIMCPLGHKKCGKLCCTRLCL